MSAPDVLAPVSVRVRLTSQDGGFERPAAVVRELLEEVARHADAAGASILGHIKCLVVTDAKGVFHANLTDLRTGARIGGEEAGPARAIDIDLVVLVYGLDHEVVQEATAAAVRAVAERMRSAWEVESPVGGSASRPDECTAEAHQNRGRHDHEH